MCNAFSYFNFMTPSHSSADTQVSDDAAEVSTQEQPQDEEKIKQLKAWEKISTCAILASQLCSRLIFGETDLAYGTHKGVLALYYTIAPLRLALYGYNLFLNGKLIKEKQHSSYAKALPSLISLFGILGVHLIGDEDYADDRLEYEYPLIHGAKLVADGLLLVYKKDTKNLIDSLSQKSFIDSFKLN